eukprot:2381438-Pleurochrysis_carterae.AAC.2
MERKRNSKFKDDLNDDQYGQLKTNRLHELTVAATGHGLPISTPWETYDWTFDSDFTKTSA